MFAHHLRMEFRYFNPRSEIDKAWHRLPHWEQPGRIYFLTWRLADAVPAKLRKDWERERGEWLLANPKPWSEETEQMYHQRFSGQIEKWLDAGHGSCVLRKPECSEIVARALRHFDGIRCHAFAWVIMPNHVHLLTLPHPDWGLEKLVTQWKGFSARQINVRLGQSGQLWQRSYFDRIIRDEAHFRNCVRYIAKNPTKAGLPEGSYRLYLSDEVRRWV